MPALARHLSDTQLVGWFLVNADWSRLVFERDPAVVEDSWSDWGVRGTDSADEDNIEAIKTLIQDHPEKIAELLDGWGIKYYSLMCTQVMS